MCLEQSGSQAGQERVCLSCSCAFLTAFSKKRDLRVVSHFLPCKLLVSKTWLLLIFDCTNLVCPQDYFKIHVKNIIKLKAMGFPVLCHCCVFANLKHRWWPGAPVASHQACGMDSCLMQAGTTGLSWEAAGFQHMGTALTAAPSQLRPAPGWSFSSLVRDVGGLMLDKGGGELFTELRSSSIAASQLCTAAFLWERPMEEPPSPLQLPHTAQRRH